MVFKAFYFKRERAVVKRNFAPFADVGYDRERALGCVGYMGVSVNEPRIFFGCRDDIREVKVRVAVIRPVARARCNLNRAGGDLQGALRRGYRVVRRDVRAVLVVNPYAVFDLVFAFADVRLRALGIRRYRVPLVFKQSRKRNAVVRACVVALVVYERGSVVHLFSVARGDGYRAGRYFERAVMIPDVVVFGNFRFAVPNGYYHFVVDTRDNAVDKIHVLDFGQTVGFGSVVQYKFHTFFPHAVAAVRVHLVVVNPALGGGVEGNGALGYGELRFYRAVV